MASIDKRMNSDTGRVSYRVRVRLKGSRPETASFDRLTDARRWAQSTEAAIREGRYFPRRESMEHTLAELIDRYSKGYLPEKKDGAHQAMQLRWWKKQIGFLSLASVTPAVIAEHRDKLKAGRKPATVNRYIAALGHAFTIAVKEYGWLESNPVMRVTKLKEPQKRVRFLDEEERSRLLKACRDSSNPDLYVAVILALSTGARQAELMWLRWDQVDFDRGVITLHETKNNERRVLPLTGEAFQLLDARSKIRRLDTDLIFPGKTNPQKPISLRVPWVEAMNKTKLEDFRWHDLRHTFASYLAMNGASLPQIAAAMGHKTLAMVQRYAHLSESHIHDVVADMTRRKLGA